MSSWCAGTPGGSFQSAITAVVHRLSPSVVQIRSPQGLGSGVVFDSGGDVVTNNHVVAATLHLTLGTFPGSG